MGRTEAGRDRGRPDRGPALRALCRGLGRPTGDRAIQRLAKIAEQAAAQSRRAWIPDVVGVTGIGDFARAQPVLLAERGGSRPELGIPLCIGPEGGWTEGELALASGTVGLGHGVLRAETAAVVGGALVCALRDGDFSL